MVKKDFPHFPTVKELKKKRAELLNELYTEPVRLKRLIKDIQHNYTTEFASIIGSIDFAEDRLSALISALQELAEKTESSKKDILQELEEFIKQDTRIDEVFEDFVFSCAQVSLN